MMYLSFYNLTEKPFQISTDPKFLWLGEKHREALASLKYGVLDNKGFLLMTGDVGTGKTTLINALIKQLGQEIICARVPDPGLSLIDFYNFIADAYQMGSAFSSKGPFLIQFGEFLNNAFARNKKVLLIVDEAQRLPDDLLEEVRVLSNILAHGQQINIFFVGQNEFNDSLLRVENRALRNRITITYNIEPLTEEETRQYIQNRLSVAGSQKEIFLPDAIQQIFAFSDGNPRRINILCDLALLTGYVQEAPQINAAIIAECAQEVSIPMLTVVNNSEPTAKNTANKPSNTPQPLPTTNTVMPQTHADEDSGKRSAYKLFIFALIPLLLILVAYLFFAQPFKLLSSIRSTDNHTPAAVVPANSKMVPHATENVSEPEKLNTPSEGKRLIDHQTDNTQDQSWHQSDRPLGQAPIGNPPPFMASQKKIEPSSTNAFGSKARINGLPAKNQTGDALPPDPSKLIDLILKQPPKE